MAQRSDPMSDEEMRTEEAAQPWAHLVPTDILRSVALHLPLSDLSNFRKVCRPWRSLPLESHPLGRSPLFLFRHFFLGEKDLCGPDKLYLYSPLYHMIFSWAASREVLDIYNNSQSSVYSKDGWLVFLIHDAIVFVNPFLPSISTAPSVIKWMMPAQYSRRMPLVSMSAPPTDPTCIFLLTNTTTGNNRIEIITGREGGTNWKVEFFDLKIARNMCLTNPVFHGDVFYCLMLPGALGIYNPRRRTWKEHHFKAEHGLGIRVNAFCILVESNGELLSVFNRRLMRRLIHLRPTVKPIVCKLNELSMEWEKLRDLRGRALFLNGTSGLSGVAEVNGMKDRIFWNKFDDVEAGKIDCELHRSAGGDLRLILRPHIGLAKLERRAKKKLAGMSLLYSIDGAGEGKMEKRFLSRGGFWFQPNWNSNNSIM